MKAGLKRFPGGSGLRKKDTVLPEEQPHLFTKAELADRLRVLAGHIKHGGPVAAPVVAEDTAILVYRVNAMVRMPVHGQDVAAAKREAIETVLDGVRLQPGGPKFFFAEPDCRVLALLEGEGVKGGRFRP